MSPAVPPSPSWDVGAVLTAEEPPDPGRMRDIYAANESRLLPWRAARSRPGEASQ